MANCASAKKRIRQNEKRRLRNRVRKESLKKSLRSFADALAGGDSAKVQEELRNASKALDKASSKGIIHKNNASRRKSNLAHAANKALASA